MSTPRLRERPMPPVPDRATIVLEYHTEPDEWGRRSFLAFWIADNIGPALDQTGVRGQAYGHVRPDEFAARAALRGMRVITVDGEAVGEGPAAEPVGDEVHRGHE